MCTEGQTWQSWWVHSATFEHVKMCISSHPPSRKHQVTVRFTGHSLTPLHTTSYFLASAAKYHLIIKPPSLSHLSLQPSSYLISYSAIYRNALHFTKCHTQYTYYSEISYFYSNNLHNCLFSYDKSRNTRAHVMPLYKPPIPICSAPDFLVVTHPKLNWWVRLHRILGCMLRKVGPMSYLKPNGCNSCWTTLSCIL